VGHFISTEAENFEIKNGVGREAETFDVFQNCAPVFFVMQILYIPEYKFFYFHAIHCQSRLRMYVHLCNLISHLLYTFTHLIITSSI
jgi:hypothetical protein